MIGYSTPSLICYCGKSVFLFYFWSKLVHAADIAIDPATNGEDLNDKIQTHWRYIVIGVAMALLLVSVMLYMQMRKIHQDQALQELNDLYVRDMLQRRNSPPYGSNLDRGPTNAVDPTFLEQQYPAQKWIKQEMLSLANGDEEKDEKIKNVLSKLCHQTCAICLEEFVDHHSIIRMLHCNHVFHKDCIDKWLLGSSLCPLCKTCIKTRFNQSN